MDEETWQGAIVMSEDTWMKWHKAQSEKMLVDITKLGTFIDRNSNDKLERKLTNIDLANMQSWTRRCLEYVRASLETQGNLGNTVHQNAIAQANQSNRLAALDSKIDAVKRDTEKTLDVINKWIEHWTPMLQEISREREDHLNRTGSQRQP
jgi:hypothetical protein